MKRTLLVILGIVGVVGSIGCGPTKGYLGPELPDEQVSTISTSYDDDEIDMSTATVDGIEFYSSGINVLPGRHNFNLSITVKDEPFDCETYPSMDDYSYDQCRDKNGSSNCDCYDYLTVYRKCFREAYDGGCDGSLSTVAGGRYFISVNRNRDGATLNISGPGSGRIGQGNCSTHGRRIAKEEESLGTGRYVAQSNGIYYCR